jgi:hypothetical protein
MNDLMIDLETLSTAPDAAMLSIGACFFDIETGVIGDTFHQHIELIDSPRFGHISVETVKWWLNQPKPAQEAVTKPKNVMPLDQVLLSLHAYITKTCTMYKVKPWGNGSSFDLVILRNAFNRHRMTNIWQYWNERDTRTLTDIVERVTGINAAKTAQFRGLKHDALADAMHQAKYVSHAYQLIKNYTSTTL